MPTMADLVPLEVLRILGIAAASDCVDELPRQSASRPLAECLAEPGTAVGAVRLRAVLERRPFPHYEAYGGEPDLLVRIDADGTRSIGRFVNRTFTKVQDPSSE